MEDSMALKLPIFVSDPYNPYGTPKLSKKRALIVGGIGFAVLLALVLTVVGLVSGSGKGDFITMLGRQQFLNKTMTDAQKSIKDEDLSKANAEASLLFTSDVISLTQQMKIKFNQDPLDEGTVKEAGDPAVASRLAEAKLLDKFDVTYRNILLQKLNQLIYSAPSIRDAVGGRTFSGVMNQYINDLKKFAGELEKLSL
jgi:hypothetical protein